MALPQDAPRLIISDIDGTFITSANRVTPRLRETITRAVSAGAHFGLATGRPHRWLIPVLEQLPLAPVCVCANGAVVYDPATDTVLHAFELMPAEMAEVLTEVERVLAGVPHGYGVERVGSSALDPEDECFLIVEADGLEKTSGVMGNPESMLRDERERETQLQNQGAVVRRVGWGNAKTPEFIAELQTAIDHNPGVKELPNRLDINYQDWLAELELNAA